MVIVGHGLVAALSGKYTYVIITLYYILQIQRFMYYVRISFFVYTSYSPQHWNSLVDALLLLIRYRGNSIVYNLMSSGTVCYISTTAAHQIKMYVFYIL